MTALPTKREARRTRDREDFIRATQQRVPAANRENAGRYAGNTYREHLEDKMIAHVEAWSKEQDHDKKAILRGIIRGLAIALLIYEDSYSIDDKRKLLELERSFMP